MPTPRDSSTKTWTRIDLGPVTSLQGPGIALVHTRPPAAPSQATHHCLVLPSEHGCPFLCRVHCSQDQIGGLEGPPILFHHWELW